MVALMRLALRLIGILAAFSVVATVLFIFRFGLVGLHAVIATGTFGVVTIAGWVLTFVAGPIAFVQLLRLRNSGRVAAIVLFGCMPIYYVVGMIAFRQPNAPLAPIIALSVMLSLLLVVLLLPIAKKICVAEAMANVLRN
jgi:hypothetical protein